MNGKRKIANLEVEDKSDVVSSTSQNKLGRKRENKSEVSFEFITANRLKMSRGRTNGHTKKSVN